MADTKTNETRNREVNSLYCLVSALAKNRAASRLVRTMAGDSRNLLPLLLD